MNIPEEFILLRADHTRNELAAHFGVTVSRIDGWCSILKLPRKAFKYRDMTNSITIEQMEIITGSLLGNGSLDLTGRHNKKNSKYIEVHSLAQYGLLEWKMNKLKPFSNDIITRKVSGRKISDSGKVINDDSTSLVTCRFDTVAHPVFTDIERKWYLRNTEGEYILQNKRRIKTIPDDLKLTPTIIAVWYFDDGSHSPNHRQAVFNTQSFSTADCERLACNLREQGINCGLGKNRDKYIITVRAASYLTLIDMVKDKLPSPCVMHKIDLSKYKPPNYSTRFIAQGVTQKQQDPVVLPGLVEETS